MMKENTETLVAKLTPILNDPSFQEQFPGVDLRIAPSISFDKKPAGEEIRTLAERFKVPVRLITNETEWALPNDAPAIEARAESLAAAIDSLWGEVEAAATPPRLTIQEIPGAVHGDRYYPHISGLLQSENHYPVSYMKPGDGIAYTSLGLGYGNRAGLKAVRFSPAYPELMPDFSMPQDIVKNSQRMFFGVNLSEGHSPATAAGPSEYTLEEAFQDGTLAPVGGVYSIENQMVYPGVYRKGVKVVTFASVLRGGDFPLPGILKGLLQKAREAGLPPLSIEFSVMLKERGDKEGMHRFVIEQVNCQRAAPPKSEGPDLADLPALGPRSICTSVGTLGDGSFPNVRDILCVCPDRLDRSMTREIADEVGAFNERLLESKRPFVLIGSGRWGTSDKYLGIPVNWHQISGACIQVEAGLDDFNVDSSRGTHFFRELTFHRIGTMHISLEREGDEVDWDWLQSRPVESEGKFVRHLMFKMPLSIRIDGLTGRGAILKPVD